MKCGCTDWGQVRENISKSSFAFKRNAIKRSKFHVYFLLVGLFNIWYSIFEKPALDDNSISHTFLQDSKCHYNR